MTPEKSAMTMPDEIYLRHRYICKMHRAGIDDGCVRYVRADLQPPAPEAVTVDELYSALCGHDEEIKSQSLVVKATLMTLAQMYPNGVKVEGA